jgi:hypothetical protein
VVKVGYIYPEQMAVAKRHILLLSPGSASLDFPSLTWERVRRPIFLLDPEMSWEPEPLVYR